MDHSEDEQVFTTSARSTHEEEKKADTGDTSSKAEASPLEVENVSSSIIAESGSTEDLLPCEQAIKLLRAIVTTSHPPPTVRPSSCTYIDMNSNFCTKTAIENENMPLLDSPSCTEDAETHVSLLSLSSSPASSPNDVGRGDASKVVRGAADVVATVVEPPLSAPPPPLPIPPPPAFTRKGRGTFNCCLRSEKPENEAPFTSAFSLHKGASMAATTTPRGLPISSAKITLQTHNETGMEGRVESQKQENLAHLPSRSGLRRSFGETREAADSLSFLLFSGEKKKRTYMLVGHLPLLQSNLTVEELPFFGRKPLQFALKPLQRIRMVITKPRPSPPSTTSEIESSHDSEENHPKGNEKLQAMSSSKEGETEVTEGEDSSESRRISGCDKTKRASGEEATAPPSSAVPGSTLGRDGEELSVAHHRSSFSFSPASSAGSPPPHEEASQQLPLEDGLKDSDERDVDDDGVYHLHCFSQEFSSAEVESEWNGKDLAFARMRCNPEIPLHVHPLRANVEERHSKNSAFLTTRRMAAAVQYLKREMAQFLSLEDVRFRSASIRLYLGSAYECKRQRSQIFSTSSENTKPHLRCSLSEFVHDVGNDATELYFIRENPKRVTEAIQALYGSYHEQTALPFARITLLSDEGQRTNARASWSEVDSSFYLYDTETQGVSIHWTIFPAEEEAVQSFLASSSNSTPASSDMHDLYISYPFEVEMRAFRRWKDSSNHPSRPLINYILRHLTHAERRAQVEGYAKAYSEFPLQEICSFDSDFEGGFHIEKIAVERISRKRIPGTEIIVDTSNTLVFENFGEARRVDGINQRGERKLIIHHLVSTCVHYRLDPKKTPMENAEHLKDAVKTVHTLLVKANDSNLPSSPTSRGKGGPRQTKNNRTRNHRKL